MAKLQGVNCNKILTVKSFNLDTFILGHSLATNQFVTSLLQPIM